MTNAYAVHIPDRIDMQDYDKLTELISLERRQRIQRFYRVEDKNRSLIAEVLLRYILQRFYGMQWDQIQFKFNPYGKPMLTDEGIQFNLSHSGSWVLCGLSDRDIGVDVEQIKEVRPDVANYCYTQSECLFIKEKPKFEQAEWFYILWTLKESYVKAEGKGLNIPFQSFEFRNISENIELQLLNGEPSEYSFQKLSLDDKHTGAMCAKNEPTNRLQIVDYGELITQI